MRILITGGFGFVGGRVAQYLHQSGNEIVLASRNTRTTPRWLPQAKVARIEWKDDLALEQICNGIDVIIHAAGMSAQDCELDPVAALEFNGLATARLLMASIRSKVKRFIYLSSAHVYNSPLTGSISEDSCPRNLHPYASSNLAGESVVTAANQRGEIKGIVIRLSNVFGTPAHKDVNCWKLLVNDLCLQVVDSGKIILHTSGIQERDFISMRGVTQVVGYLTLYESSTLLPRIYNVGSGESQSVLKVAQLVQQRCKVILGFEPKIQRLEIIDDQKHESLDYRSDRLNKTGFKIEFDSSSEIDSLLDFCRVMSNHDRIDE